MALEKPIIKARVAAKTTFDYKPRDLGGAPSMVARSYVDEDAFRSSDFKISELISQQAGITQLESDAHQDKINTQVLGRLKEIEERGYKEGYDLGLIEGTENAFQAAKQDLINKMVMFETVLKRLEDIKTALLIDNEAELIRVIFQIAKKMALRDLADNREAVAEILKHVVGEMQASERVTVRLSNEDLAFIETLQAKSDHQIEALKRARMIGDDKMTSGGCIIETDYGSVDASVEERVERTWQTLLARIPQKAPEKKED